jgi:hypothetical protein
MSKRIIVAALLCAGLTAACGGDGSGVSRSKSLVSLSDGERTELCEYLADTVEERVVNCGGGVVITSRARSVTSCVATHEALPASCTATVGDAEDCSEDYAALTEQQLCADARLPAACQALVACGAF